MRFLLISYLTLVLINSFPVSAITIPATEDSYSSRGQLTNATNKAPTLTVDSARTGFVYFDLQDVDASTADQIRYARLRVYFPKVTASGGGVSLHVATSAWDETLAGAAPTHDPAPAAAIAAGAVRGKAFASADVTDAVKSWISGAVQNQGIAIRAVNGAKLIVGAKEGSGSGYPTELEIELNPAPGVIGNEHLAPNLNLPGTTTGVFSGSGSGLTGLQAAHIAGQIANAQLANSGFSFEIGPGLVGSPSVLLGGTASLSNAGVLSLSSGGGITVSSATGAITLGSNATSAPAPLTLVQRDGNGDFQAGTITATFKGDGSALTGVPLPQAAAARLLPGPISQSIPSNVSVALQWTLEDFDTNDMHDVGVNNTRLTAQQDGIYSVTVNEQIGQDQVYGHLSLYKNGVEGPGLLARGDKAPGTTTVTVTTLVELRIGDYLEASFVQNSGSTILLSRFSRSFFTIHRVSAAP